MKSLEIIFILVQT